MALAFLVAAGLSARALDHAVDASAQVPGMSHRVRVQDLPRPNATPAARNDARRVPRPPGAWPQVPEGFRVSLFAQDLPEPRELRTAPSGDVFVNNKRGEILVLRGRDARGAAKERATFAAGLDMPFGMAFYPTGAAPAWLYVGDTDALVRFRYAAGDLQARAAPEHLFDFPGGGKLHGGGHWTRDLAFSRDGKKLYAAVGSRSNVDDPDTTPEERGRAVIWEMTPDGKNARLYATGVRNAVGLAVSPKTGELWASVNERDNLGDDLPPDYVTHVVEGGFYGWPWYYLGPHQDPRHAGKHPELAGKVIVPDVLLASHVATMQLLFYDGASFPAAYRGDIFAPQRGSWNRSVRSGYGVARIPLDASGHAKGTYEDFLTGFVTPAGDVWGRPVGITVDSDGALLVSDEMGGCIWRVEATKR
ncbi:MAG TPA: PQQ-dependent sugar dehydrogenase [Polyangia bacterium]|nr:PQQ-dependent sugar dehydrogenase [Polyangia bacterium]